MLRPLAGNMPGLDLFASALIDVGAPTSGSHPDARDRIVPILGGTVTGQGWTGAVRGGGADHQKIASPGMTELHAMYFIEVTGGPMIHVENRALRSGDPEVMARLNAGESVDPADVYFRGAVRFTAGVGNPFSWIDSRLFVCAGLRHARAVAIDFYALR